MYYNNLPHKSNSTLQMIHLRYGTEIERIRDATESKVLEFGVCKTGFVPLPGAPSQGRLEGTLYYRIVGELACLMRVWGFGGFLLDFLLSSACVTTTSLYSDYRVVQQIVHVWLAPGS